MKTRKIRRLWFLEKVVFSRPRHRYTGNPQNLPPIIGEGVVYDFVGLYLYVALTGKEPTEATMGSMCMELDCITKKQGKLGREECLTHGNEIIRKIGLDNRIWQSKKSGC